MPAQAPALALDVAVQGEPRGEVPAAVRHAVVALQEHRQAGAKARAAALAAGHRARPRWRPRFRSSSPTIDRSSAASRAASTSRSRRRSTTWARPSRGCHNKQITCSWLCGLRGASTSNSVAQMEEKLRLGVERIKETPAASPTARAQAPSAGHPAAADVRVRRRLDVASCAWLCMQLR